MSRCTAGRAIARLDAALPIRRRPRTPRRTSLLGSTHVLMPPRAGLGLPQIVGIPLEFSFVEETTRLTTLAQHLVGANLACAPD
jgi:hypothetical protein